MKLNPKDAQKSTLSDYPVYCRQRGKRQVCGIRAKRCTQGEVIGTLAIVTDGGNLWGVAPLKRNGLVTTANNVTRDHSVYRRLYDVQVDYYTQPELEGKITETGLVDVQTQRQPLTSRDNELFYVYGYKEFIYFTFYCDNSDYDYKFTLKQAKLHNKMTTMIAHPTYCAKSENKKQWECIIKSKGCEEGEVIGTLMTIGKYKLSW